MKEKISGIDKYDGDVSTEELMDLVSHKSENKGLFRKKMGSLLYSLEAEEISLKDLGVEV